MLTFHKKYSIIFSMKRRSYTSHLYFVGKGYKHIISNIVYFLRGRLALKPIFFIWFTYVKLGGVLYKTRITN